MKRLITATIIFLALLSLTATRAEQIFPSNRGSFLGQFQPDTLPELFATGIVSTGMFTRDMAISPDGKAFFFMSNRTDKLDPDHWNYDKLTELYNSPKNGNSDIWWMDTGFIKTLHEKAMMDN